MLFTELDESLVMTGIPATTRDEVIEYLLGMLNRTGKVRDLDRARADIERNEEVMSFGMQHGIAIPHAKTDAVEELLACIAVSEHPVDFAGIDGTPSRIFIMTLSPPDQVGPHVRFLSEIGRLLKNRKLRKAILQAETPAQLLSVIKGR